LGALFGGVVLLARPPVYEAQATVHYDPQRYDFAVLQEGDGPSVLPLLAQEASDMHILLSPQDLNTSSYIGQPVEFQAEQPGVLRVFGRALQPERAQSVAANGATALSEALRSIYGWNLLRTLLRRTIYLQAQSQPEPPSALTPHLFDLLEAGFITYDPAFRVAPEPPVLTALDVSDVTLAVQRMDDRLTAHIDALFGRQAQAEDPDERAQIQAETDAFLWRREQLRKALITLYREQDSLAEAGGGGSLPEIVPPVGPPTEPLGFSRWTFLLIGLGSGFFLGVALTLIEDRFGLVGRLRDVITYRDLVWNLVMRDLKARYKSSVLGYLWSLVNPLLMMTVFTVLFKFLLKSEIPNFPVFIIVALLPWNYCATAVSGAVVSITGQASLIKKVYFPREAIPIAVVIANLINYLLAMPAMFLIMLLLNAHFQWVALLFPVIALIQTVFLLGVSLFLSSLNVFFRDTQVIMEVLLTAWFFLTPIFYRLDDIVDERLARLVRWFNPMASLVDFYRDIFYLGGMPGWDAIIRTLVTSLGALLVGYIFFLRLSPRFGEEI
jgi:lipopolysaccharide transport system permease protein